MKDDSVQLKDKDKFPQSTSKTELYGRKLELCVLWNHRDIISFEFLNHNPTLIVNSQQRQHVHENLLRKRPALVNCRNIVFLYENARPNLVRIPLVCSTLSTIFTRSCTKWFPSFSFSTKFSEWRYFEENQVKTFGQNFWSANLA